MCIGHSIHDHRVLGTMQGIFAGVDKGFQVDNAQKIDLTYVYVRII
jgi:hypothetical protein